MELPISGKPRRRRRHLALDEPAPPSDSVEPPGPSPRLPIKTIVPPKSVSLQVSWLPQKRDIFESNLSMVICKTVSIA